MKRQAVSEVIGTLILVGIVVAAIGLVGILLLSNPTPSKVPVLNSLISNRSKTIYIYHKGGDPLFAGQYQIFVDGVDRTGNFAIMSPGSEPWSVGDTLAATMPAMPRRVVFILNQSGGGSGGGGGGGGTVMMESDLSPILVVPLHPPSPPSVAWSRTPAFGNLTISFQFTDSSTGENITSYSWDFGDGNTSTTQSLSHAFPCNTGDSCPYNIGHSATDSGGTNWEATTWLNRSAYVTVYKNQTPTITFTQDKTSGPAGFLTVNFAATQVGFIKVDSWYWTFGAGEGTSSSEDPSHTYNTKGIYTVTLTATNYTLGVTTVTKSNLIRVTEPWYGCGWLYRKNITIDESKVAADLTNFPVLINLTSDADLAADAQNDGDDIVFTSSDGTTKLSHEIESFSGGTGGIVAWVKVSPLSSTVNTTLFMYYGNAGAPSQQDAANVWDASFEAVWHLKELGSGAAGEYKDSKNTNHGRGGGGTAAQVPARAAGKMDYAQDFDAGNDWINAASAGSVDQIFGTGGTFSAWIFPQGVGENSEGRIGDKSSTATSCDGGWCFSTFTGPELRFRKGHSGSGSVDGIWSTAAGTITLSAWQHVVVTYNQGAVANDPIIYINGVSKALTETTPVGTVQSDAALNLVLGNFAGAQSRTFDGIIDEVRASKTIRSANWILTEYNNQNSPSTFHYRMAQEAWTC